MGRKVVGLAHPMWPKYTEAHYQLTYFLFVREKKLTYCLFFSCRVCRTVRWLILPREHGPKVISSIFKRLISYLCHGVRTRCLDFVFT
jgi:hypothetical protein